MFMFTLKNSARKELSLQQQTSLLLILSPHLTYADSLFMLFAEIWDVISYMDLTVYAIIVGGSSWSSKFWFR